MKCFIRNYVNFVIVLIACMMGCTQSTSDTGKETDAIIKQILEGESVEEQAKIPQKQRQEAEPTEDQIEALKQKAKESLDAGDHKKAAEYLIKAGQLAASDDRDSGQSGRSLILQGKFDEAKKQCQKAYNRDPLNFTFAVNLGHSYLLIGDAATARTYYEKAFLLITSEDEFNAVLADFKLFIKNGWQIEACRRESAWMTEAFDTVYRFHLEANKYWAQARALRKKGQEREVIQLWEKGIEAEQASPKPRLDVLVFQFNLLGDCYTGVLGQHLKALKNYKQALELNRKLDLELNRKLDQEELILYKIGKVYSVLGEYPQALEYFEQALELSHTLTRENHLGAKYGTANNLYEIGRVYTALQEYLKALEYFEQALELNRQLEREDQIAENLFEIARVYNALEEYPKALTYYEQALQLYRNLGKDTEIALALNNIGLLYYGLGDYPKALGYYKQALELNRQLGQEARAALALNNIAGVHDAWGQYDKELDYLEQALEIFRQLGRDADIATSLNNIGGVYRNWGQYKNALDYFEQALELFHKLGQEAELTALLNNIGYVYRALGQLDKALTYYEQALELGRKLGQNAEEALMLNNIGTIYQIQKQYDKAFTYYRQALERSRRLGRDADVVLVLANIGWVYQAWGQYTKALDYNKQALKLARTLEMDAEVAAVLSNIGAIYFRLKEFSEAITSLKESIEILERLRKTASGNVRWDYLASQIGTYQLLTLCYIRTNDFSKALEIVELSRAKLLAERLAGSDEVNIPSLEHIQNKLSEDTAVLVYANTDQENMIHMIITKEHITALEHSVSDFVQEVIKGSEPETEEEETTFKRGLAIGTEEQQKPVVPNTNEIMTFATIIRDYRRLLQDVRTIDRGLKQIGEQGRTDETRGSLGRRLYDVLLSDIQEYLAGKAHLLIVPDGVLNFIPFETLIDEQGRYLTETYTISYAQSLAVLDLVEQREYTQDRKPLLAFGGAVYDAPTYQTQMVENEVQLAYLQKQVDDALNKGKSVGKLYAQLRGEGWSNLPGTLQEVNAIQQVVPGAKIVIGEDVNEAAVKELSAKGELANYRVLHFATHGDADPRIPELSALVLSLGAQASLPAKEPTPRPSHEGKKAPSPLVGEGWGEGEDGYLWAGEIVNLKLNADFVNLSACETGLGKLYSGEGMVGLTQAFLLAGANGLSVSLWSVADESTAAFMTALYKLVEEQDLNYAEAISEVKRRFINGDFGEKWKAPYYWAPFVYYGK